MHYALRWTSLISTKRIQWTIWSLFAAKVGFGVSLFGLPREGSEILDRIFNVIFYDCRVMMSKGLVLLYEVVCGSYYGANENFYPAFFSASHHDWLNMDAVIWNSISKILFRCYLELLSVLYFIYKFVIINAHISGHTFIFKVIGCT